MRAGHVGGRGHDDQQGHDCGDEHADREEVVRRGNGQRPEGTRRVRHRVRPLVPRPDGSSGRHQDEPANGHREEAAQNGIDSLGQKVPAMASALHLHAGLPDVHVAGQRGAEHGQSVRQVLVGPLEIWHHGASNYGTPIGTGENAGGGKRQREEEQR